MPMIDVKSSAGALPADSLPDLADRLTTVLLGHREVPDTEQSRRKVWSFFGESVAFVAGRAPVDPHVVAEFTIVAGGMTQDHKEGLVADATEAIRAVAAEAEVWVLIHEVADGSWGDGGAVTRLADAQAMLGAAGSD